jgi:hypothetical protein
VHLDLWNLHRDPEQYPEPLKFQPERFFDKEVAKKRHPNAWQGFGDGARKCLGYRLATMEIIQVGGGCGGGVVVGGCRGRGRPQDRQEAKDSCELASTSCHTLPACPDAPLLPPPLTLTTPGPPPSDRGHAVPELYL